MEISGRDRDAGAAVVVGLGEAGGRVVARTQARLADAPLERAGGLTFLQSDPSAASLEDALASAVRAGMRQSAVSRLESGFHVRRPQHRVLKLTLVYVAALADTTPETLPDCLRAAGALNHPPAGLQTLFLLSAVEGQGGAARPDDLARLRALERGAADLADRQAREWGASGRLRVLLTHPHRADGSWLDPPEEFEAALASLLAAHLVPGAAYDGLTAGSETAIPPFALGGWSGATLPRELILSRAAELLAADVLEQTSTGEGTPEAMVSAGAPELWQGWQNVQETLLDRRSLLRRLLGPNPSGVVVVAEDEAVRSGVAPQQPWSLIGELKALFWGEARPLGSSGGLRVRLSLPSARWQAGDPHRWPQEIGRLDAEGALLLDHWLADASVLPPLVAGEAVAALSHCVDHCVARHVGGTAAAQALITEAERRARTGLAEQIPFSEPFLPDDLGLPPGADFAECWEIFQTRCRRIPNWQAALAGGAAWGSLALSACLPLGILLGIGWIGAGLGLLVGGVLYGWRLGSLKRLADYLRQCLEAKYGRRLLEYAERAAGTPTHEGVYQAILHSLDTTETPAVAGFAEQRRARIAEARRPRSLPPLGGTEEYLLDLDAASDLHDLLRRTFTSERLADLARSLLRADGLFDAWRSPDWEEIAGTVTGRARRDFLAAWERPFKDLGTFVRDLRPDSASYPAWVRDRLDRMAMRAMLLALRPPAHLERDNAGEDADAPSGMPTDGPTGWVRVEAPASLTWHAALTDSTGSSDAPMPGGDQDRLPPGSAAADLADWYGGDVNACRVGSEEADAASCLVLTVGLTAAQALAAVARPPAMPPAAEPGGNGYNATRNGHANGNGAGPVLVPSLAAPPVRLPGGEEGE